MLLQLEQLVVFALKVLERWPHLPGRQRVDNRPQGRQWRHVCDGPLYPCLCNFSDPIQLQNSGIMCVFVHLYTKAYSFERSSNTHRERERGEWGKREIIF